MFSTTQRLNAKLKIMKRSVLVIIAILLLEFNCNAQNKNQEAIRLQLAQAMVDLTNSLNLAYENSDNVEEFKKTVTGCWYPEIPREGNDLLNAAYELLYNKFSKEEVLKNYSGKEMAQAILFIDKLTKKGIKTDGSELFGGTTGDFNSYSNLILAQCRWYQMCCWLAKIFDGYTGTTLLSSATQSINNLSKTE